MALMPVAEALRRVLADAKPLPAETVPLKEAFGRVLTARCCGVANAAAGSRLGNGWLRGPRRAMWNRRRSHLK